MTKLNLIVPGLALAIGLAPLAASAQDAGAPAKSERAMPDTNTAVGKTKPKKSERAMSGNAKDEKAKAHGSERAMPTEK